MTQSTATTSRARTSKAPLVLREPWSTVVVRRYAPESWRMALANNPAIWLGQVYITGWARRQGRENGQIILSVLMGLFAFSLSQSIRNPFDLVLFIFGVALLLAYEVSGAHVTLKDTAFLATLPLTPFDLLKARSLFALRIVAPPTLAAAIGITLGQHAQTFPLTWLFWCAILLLVIGSGILLFPWKSTPRVMITGLLCLVIVGNLIHISPRVITQQTIWHPIYWTALLTGFTPKGRSLGILLGMGGTLLCTFLLSVSIWLLNLRTRTIRLRGVLPGYPRWPVFGQRVSPVVGWTLGLLQQHRPLRVMIWLWGGFGIALLVIIISVVQRSHTLVNSIGKLSVGSVHFASQAILLSLAAAATHEVIFAILLVIATPLFGTFNERRALRALPLRMETMLKARWVALILLVSPLLLEAGIIWWVTAGPSVALASFCVGCEAFLTTPLVLVWAFIAAKGETRSMMDRLVRVLFLSPYHFLLLLSTLIGLGLGQWLIGAALILGLNIVAAFIGWFVLCSQYRRWS